MRTAKDTQTLPTVRGAIWWHLVLAFVFSIFVNTLFLASPLYMMQLYGRVLDSRRMYSW